jgi:hypothetical protein
MNVKTKDPGPRDCVRLPVSISDFGFIPINKLQIKPGLLPDIAPIISASWHQIPIRHFFQRATCQTGVMPAGN